ncbi:hypothetical protein [Rhodovulum sp. YEN HP10]|uniref:hypothetical protein n=1 Tax=Rhodovulum sp. HP10 TaxID=3387397 RepID=UPI0039E05BF4
MPIIDWKSAETWLKTQPHEVQFAFDTRCALRALPAVTTARDEVLSGIVLSVLRAILASGSASFPILEEESSREIEGRCRCRQSCSGRRHG